MAWTITYDIYKEEKAASDAAAKFRVLAESARGDGTFLLRIDPKLLDAFRIDVTPDNRTVSVTAQDSISLLYAAYDFENK